MWRGRNARTASPSCTTFDDWLKEPAGFVEIQARVAREKLSRVAIPDIAQEVGLHLVKCGRIASRGREELRVHLCIIEAGHGSTIEPQRASREDKIAALQASIAKRRYFGDLRR